MAKSIIYLDHAAATPVDPKVLAAMQPYFTTNFYNPSANYLAAKQVKQALDVARNKVAHWVGARSSEIIFTAGGTEANNLAIHGVMSRFPKANIITSQIEHDSVLAPASHYNLKQVSVNQDGRIDLEDLRSKIDKNTVLVSVGYANSEIGTVQPLRQISKIIEENRSQADRKLPLYFHTDACQAANYLDLHAARLGVDLMTLNGGKIYGPKQSGALYVKAGLALKPVMEGGGQERGLRSGTENVTGIIGLAEALDLAQTGRQVESARLHKLQDLFFEGIDGISEIVTVNGSKKFRLPNNIHVTFAGQDNERLLIQLDELGIMAAAGSACSASDDTPSHVLKAIGLTDENSRSSLRFSMGRQTDQSQISQTTKALNQILA